MSIFIDADACPVRDEVIRVAERHKTKVFIVSNGNLRPHRHPLVKMVFVPDGPDVADDWIAQRAAGGDVVITADIPLADRCIAAGARVIQPNGEVLDMHNIGPVLAGRDLMTDLRAANPLMQGGAKPFSKADRSHFLNVLENEMRKVKTGT